MTMLAGASDARCGLPVAEVVIGSPKMSCSLP
jgi:hypothetical protein